MLSTKQEEIVKKPTAAFNNVLIYKSKTYREDMSYLSRSGSWKHSVFDILSGNLLKIPNNMSKSQSFIVQVIVSAVNYIYQPRLR